jgi:cholest-4-en-3-one 26-monooxygenase
MGAVVLLANGGSETTRAALSHGMIGLLNHPDQMAWLRERKDGIPETAAQEIIRWASPIIHMCRTLTRDVELHGTTIPEGERVALLWACANFDPDQFEAPMRFDLSRDPNPHTAFGRGPHACLGKHIAALETKVLMRELLSRTKDIRLTGDVQYVRDSFARGVYDLPVELIPA